ncbi:hypothetical protein EAF04_002652 [Stromatinia cepivora]|nr:hypothetical protein EAF04_002652 [Stromatinia cepivora]
MEYDDWGKLCKVTESSGLVTLSLTDPITQTKIEGIKGEGMVKTQLNIFDVPVQTTLCKSDDTVYSKIDYTYDGLGRLVSETDQLGRTTEYKADSFDRIVETIWPNNRVVKTRYANQTTAVLPMSMELNGSTVGEQSFDGLGRVTRRTVGTRTTSQSYEGVSPEPACITSPRGDQHNLTYEPALDYMPTGLTSSDNLTTDTYQYDAQTAVPIQFMNSYSTYDLQYFPSGLLSQENIQTSGGQVFSAEYIYSMSGKLQQYTDMNGKTHEIQYDACGRPQTIVQGQLKVSLVYDNASRASESCVEDGTSNSQIKSSLSYDDFGREIKRSVYKGETTLLYHLSQIYGETGLIISRRKEEGNGDVSRDESFEYDIHNRLVKYKCQGNQPPTDQQGHQLQSQGFIFDDYDNISQCSTVFQDGSSNTAVYSFSAEEPTQLIKITNTHPDYPPEVDLDYDENGCLTRDEQGRILQYNNMSRLIAVSDANNQILAEYQYDGTGKLVCQQVPGEADTCVFYRDSLIVAVCKGDRKTSFLSNESEYWGETISENNQTTTNLWASDGQQSITTILNTGVPDQIQHQEYTPYCFSDLSAGTSIGFNGQWRDPVTGWYHLGNGYRVYNPVLMQFHTPDPSSPFTSGEINPYSYCLGDPINRVDPSGHFSLFGIHFGFKDLIMAIFGIIVGIAVGILTAGAGFAIEVGVGLAAGVASDVTSGVIGDLAEGKVPTWKSVGMDALGGLIGGIGGELGGAVLKQGMRMVKAAPMVIKRALGRAGSAAITKPLAGEAGKSLAAIAKSSIRGAAREFIPAQVAARGALYGIDPPSDESSKSQAGSQALSSSSDKIGAPSKPLGNHGPAHIGSHPFYFERGSSIARNTIRPAKKEGADVSAHIMTMLASSYGSETGAGQSFVTNLLNREARVAYGPLTANPSKRDSGSKQH